MFEGGNYRKNCIFQQVDMIFSHGCSVFSLHNHFRKHSHVFTFYAAAAVWFKFHRLVFFLCCPGLRIVGVDLSFACRRFVVCWFLLFGVLTLVDASFFCPELSAVQVSDGPAAGAGAARGLSGIGWGVTGGSVGTRFMFLLIFA